MNRTTETRALYREDETTQHLKQEPVLMHNDE